MPIHFQNISNMEKQLLIIGLLAAAILLFIACNGTKNTVSNGSTTTVWVNSTTHADVTFSNDVGAIALADCYSIVESDKLPKNEMGFITAKWEPFCGTIKGFEREDGYIYQLKIKKLETDEMLAKSNVKGGKWELVKEVSKERDEHFKRREVKTAWIGPKKIMVRCHSPMAPPDCKEERHQVQFSENYDPNGTWEPMYDIFSFPGFAKGNIYQIQYTKVYLSEWEQRSIADHVGFSAEDIKVLMVVSN